MNEESDIQQEATTDAMRWLARGFEALVEANTPENLEEVPGQIVNLSNQVSQVETKQQQSLNGLESVKQELEKLGSASKLLENVGEVNQLLGQEHYNRHIIQPMVRSLFPIFDIIADSREFRRHCSCNTNSLMDSIRSQLQQFLANYDIETIEHEQGDSFDPKTSKSIMWEVTSEERLDKKVAYSLRTGFRSGKERILRTEMVSLFKYKPSETNTNTLIEGVEK